MKHKFFSKRGLALVVSVMMCLSAMSTTAWAGSFKDLQDEIDKAEDGNVVLKENYTYGEDENSDNTTISINKDITLNLNGWTISGSGNGKSNNNAVITVEGTGNLTLKDDKTVNPETANEDDAAVGTITGGKGSGKADGKKGGGVFVDTNGKFTMDGGKITGNTVANDGAGVYVNGGEFTMKNGEISGNTAKGSGGGIYLNGGKLDMTGGTITSNNSNYVDYGGGGGVYVNQGAFTMSGESAITNNHSAGSGAGVYVNAGASFTMDNGKIAGNATEDRGGGNNGGEGGGVYVGGNNTSKGTFTMNGGEITGNTSTKQQGGGGVRVWKGQFTMNGGKITDNTANYAEADNLQSIAAKDKSEAIIYAGTVGADAERFVESICQHKDNTAGVITVCKEHSWTGATCTQKATCSACGAEGAVDSDVHNLVDADDAKTATCTEAGQTASKVCTWCKQTIEKGTPMGINPDAHEFGDAWESDSNSHWHVCTHSSTHTSEREAHNWGDWSEWSEPDANNNQTQTRTCNVCGAEDVRNQTVTPTPGGDDDNTGDTDTEDPGTVVIPDPDVPLGDEPAPATATIADEDVPLAGLVTLAQLLDELYRHEGAPEVHIPDGFPFADHEYAEAICWGLDNALVFHTEEEPLDPDEIVTVGLMREVLTNFVAYRGVEEFTVELAGADDEIVMDLGERLVVFYAQLAEAEAAAEADEAEAA